MLAQMGQMMQMRQMQQGFESENALRDFYAQGGDPSSAEGRRQLLSRNPSAGMKIIGQLSENSARDINTAEKSLGLYKDQVGFIKSPDDAARWLSNFYANPLTRPYVESVAPMDVALAAIPKNDPAAFQAWLRNASLKAEKLFVDANTEATNKTRIQAAGISAAPGFQQAETARQRLKMEQSGTWTKGIIGDRVVLVNNRTGEIKDAMMPEPEPEPSGTVTVGPITTIPEPTGGGAAPINALAPQPAAGAAPVTNALVQPPATATPARQPLTTFNPQKVAKETVNAAGDVTQFNERGETIRVVPKAGKPSAAVEKEQAAIQKVPEAIAMNNDAIRKIDEMIGGVDARGNPLEGAKGQPHPGLSKATGLGGGVMRFFSGTEGKNFEIRHKEVLSQAFLDAFEALKGGGAITEKEGDKATAARTRMDLAQSKEEYITAAREYQGVLKRGVENARARMQRSGTAPPAGAPEDPLGIR
jgi:hypothetical protein